MLWTHKKAWSKFWSFFTTLLGVDRGERRIVRKSDISAIHFTDCSRKVNGNWDSNMIRIPQWKEGHCRTKEGSNAMDQPPPTKQKQKKIRALQSGILVGNYSRIYQVDQFHWSKLNLLWWILNSAKINPWVGLREPCPYLMKEYQKLRREKQAQKYGVNDRFVYAMFTQVRICVNEIPFDS